MLNHQPIAPQTLAVLLGASSFRRAPRLAQGRAFYNSAQDFFEYLLASNGLNLPRDNVIWLFDDSRSPSDQLQDVGDFLESRSAELKNGGTPPQDLIAYYVGHGLFSGPDQAYCLAIRATDERSEGLTSIRVSDLASIIKAHARFLRKFLILDCCFSSAAYKEFQSGPLQTGRIKLLEELPQKGTTLLCSASAQDPSLAPEGLSRTMFSHSLLRALGQGHPFLGPRLSLSELGDLVKVDLEEAYPDAWVRPEVHSPDQREGDVADVRLFPNPAFAAKQAEEARLKAEAEERARKETEAREQAEVRGGREAQGLLARVTIWQIGSVILLTLIGMLSLFIYLRTERTYTSHLTTLLSLDNGSLWVGAYSVGLARLDKGGQWQTYRIKGGLPSDDVYALAPGPDSSLWVGTVGGLGWLKRADHWQTYTKASTNGGLPSDYVYALAPTPDGSLWVGTTDGLARLNKEGRWQTYTKASTNGGLPSDYVYALAPTPDGSLWVGTSEGLARLNREGRWQTYTKASTNGGLPSDDVHVVAFGPDGSVWAAAGVYLGDAGLGRFDKGGHWHTYTEASTNGGLPSDYVYALAPTPDGSLWVGTSEGLARLNREGRWQIYTSQLPSDDIRALAFDPDGSLWVGTYEGSLGKLDKDGRWQTYIADLTFRYPRWPPALRPGRCSSSRRYARRRSSARCRLPGMSTTTGTVRPKTWCPSIVRRPVLRHRHS